MGLKKPPLLKKECQEHGFIDGDGIETWTKILKKNKTDIVQEGSSVKKGK